MLIVFFRALILYCVVFLVIRLMGKKELSKVQPFELAIIIVISDLASAPMSSRGLSLLDGIIPIITLLLAYLIFLLLNHSSNKVQDIVCGKPVLIIKDGKIVEKEFNSQKYTVSDLMSQLHEKDVFSISDVKYGILETNGNLSVIKNDPNIETLPVNVIEDGKLSDANMELLGISKGDVERLVKAKKVKIEDILVGQMDSNYKFTYQLKEKEV
ncbi:MAG: DUF421 domain-containing protein [Clostridia bacterium]